MPWRSPPYRPPAKIRARHGREEHMERTAQCHCGQLKAIAAGEPERVYVCHCKACQRRTGAIIHNGSSWQKSQVRIEGDDKVYARMADSGFEIRFHFCPNCGTSVFWEGDRIFFFSSRRRHTISLCDWSSDVCSSD